MNFFVILKKLTRSLMPFCVLFFTIYSTAAEFTFPPITIDEIDFIGLSLSQALERICTLNRESLRTSLTPSLLIELEQTQQLLKSLKKNLTRPHEDPNLSEIIDGEMDAILIRLRSITTKLGSFNDLLEQQALLHSHTTDALPPATQ